VYRLWPTWSVWGVSDASLLASANAMYPTVRPVVTRAGALARLLPSSSAHAPSIAIATQPPSAAFASQPPSAALNGSDWWAEKRNEEPNCPASVRWSGSSAPSSSIIERPRFLLLAILTLIALILSLYLAVVPTVYLYHLDFSLLPLLQKYAVE